jgi:hypothetical protein
VGTTKGTTVVRDGRGREIVRRGTAVERANRRVGPLDRRGVPGSREAYAHARGVWEDARRAVAGRADQLARDTAGQGRDTAAFNGQVDLVLVGALGAHLATCGVCWVKWIDGWRPADILTGAVRRRPAGQVLRAAELEARARRTRGSGA